MIDLTIQIMVIQIVYYDSNWFKEAERYLFEKQSFYKTIVIKTVLCLLSVCYIQFV